VRSSLRSAIVVLAAAPALTGWSFFDPFHENVEKGNKAADTGENDAALDRYGEAARVDPSSPIPDFNRGIVLSKKGDTDQALDAFRAAAASEDPAVASDALYNLGNVYMEGQQFEPAIDAYLKSLDLDPRDEDARRNFEIALRRLQEQQQQQQEQQQQQQQDKKDDDRKDEQQPDQPKDQPDERNQEESPSPDDQENQEEPPSEEQPPPQEDRLSREDAERLLNAVQSDELKVLEQLQQKQPPQGGVDRDW